MNRVILGTMLCVGMLASLPAATAGPERPHRITVSYSPEAPLLGRDSDVVVTFTVVDAAGAAVQDAQLELSTTVGWFEAPEPVGEGRYQASYVPPPTRFPQVALVAAWEAGRREESILFAIPLTGVTRFPVQGLPGVPITFEVAGKGFGPFLPDDKGVAQVELEVPPGVTRALAVAARDDGRTERSVELPAPPFVRLKVAPLPSMPADGQSAALVRLLVVDRAGAPLTGARVELSAALGSVSPPVDRGSGLYIARYTPPRLYEARVDTLRARLPEEGESQSARLEISLLPVAPPEPVAIVLPQGEPPVPPPDRPLRPLELPPPAGGGSTAVLESDGANGNFIAPEAVMAPPVAPAGDGSLPVTALVAPAGDGSPPVEAAAEVVPPAAPVVEVRAREDSDRAPRGFGVVPGGRLFPLLALGYYQFRQVPASGGGALPSDVWTISAPTLLSAGLGLDDWFTPSFGVSLRYEAAYYRFVAPGLDGDDHQTDLKQLLSADARARLPLRLSPIAAAIGGRLGVTLQDHPSFERTPDGGVRFVGDNTLALWALGIDLQAFPTGRIELWGSYGVGFDLTRFGQVSQRLELGGLYDLGGGVSIGLAAEGWQRHLTAMRADDGAEEGTLRDVWGQLWGFGAIHF